MSYCYEVLMEIYNYGDENGEGRNLYNSLFNEEGGLKSDWKITYTNWVYDLCEMNGVGKGAFRDCFVRDAISEAFDGDLEKIKDWFAPEEQEEEEEEEEEEEQQEEDEDTTSVSSEDEKNDEEAQNPTIVNHDMVSLYPTALLESRG